MTNDPLVEALSGILERAKLGEYGPISVVAAEALDNARRAVELDSVRREIEVRQREWSARFYKAVMLAQDVETLEALLDGESVPVDRLDAEWLDRFGYRPGAAA
jgi:hypothetical protein